MGYAYGSYFATEWGLAALALIVSVAVALRAPGSRWSTLALGLFVACAGWKFASVL